MAKVRLDVRVDQFTVDRLMVEVDSLRGTERPDGRKAPKNITERVRELLDLGWAHEAGSCGQREAPQPVAGFVAVPAPTELLAKLETKPRLGDSPAARLAAAAERGFDCADGNCPGWQMVDNLRGPVGARNSTGPVVAAPWSVAAQKADVISDLQAKINAVQYKPAAASWATEDDPWDTPYEPELETPAQRSLRLQAEAGQENQDVVGEEPA